MQSQPTAKRKAPLDMESSNPLMAAAAAKRAKKPPSKKFRADFQPPPSSSSRPRPPSQSKPFSTTSSRHLQPHQEIQNEGEVYSDADLEKDVRAMEDETDRLRRNSRAHTTLDPAILASDLANPAFHFPPSSSKSSANAVSRVNGNRRASKSRPKTPSSMSMDVDTHIPIAENETPQIMRNKRLREGAMAAIVTVAGERDSGSKPREMNGNDIVSKATHRRKSSLSRGKRISTSFETTGVITQPHNSVSGTSFYKHIDADLPEVERIRQLLIWCSLRAASSSAAASSPTKPMSKPSSSTASDKDKDKPPLPPLSAKAALVLKKVQDEFVRMLAEKRIDLSLHGPPEANLDDKGREELKENEQNIRNRNWEITYSKHIQKAEAEDEAWKRVSYEYDAYAKKLQASIEKRRKVFDALKLDGPSSSAASANRKGKGKATNDNEEDDEPEEDRWLSSYPQPHELPHSLQRGAELAHSLLSRSKRRNRDLSSKDDAIDTGGGRTSRPPTRPSLPGDLEAELTAQLPLLEYKVDLLHTYANAARGTTNICERLLDERFRILNKHLEMRMRSASVPPPTFSSSAPSGEGKGKPSASSSKSHVLTTYIKRSRSPTRTLYPSSLPLTNTQLRSASLPPPPPPLPSTSHIPSPHTLLRALTRVDATRQPSQIGDAARRAAREVQRVEESGIGAVAGERRVTLVAGNMGLPATPRKGGVGAPGTPGRKERTPGRERTPRRERTPGRERTPVRDR